jgi:AraC-like DNA-binding protein
MPVHTEHRVLHRSECFELGEFLARPHAPSDVRESVALSHLMVFPRSCSEVVQERGEPIIATPNQALFYNKGCRYTCRIIGGESEVTTYVRLSETTVADCLRTLGVSGSRGGGPLPIRRAAMRSGEYLAHWRAVARASRGTPDALQVDELLHGLLGTLVLRGIEESRSRADAAPSKRDFARWACEVIAGSYREPLTVHEIAERVGVSPFYLCRVFRAETGTTMHAYRDALRLRDSVGRLMDGGVTLSRLAVEMGYSSQSHYTASFRRHFGLPPHAAVRKLGDDPGFLARN